MIKDNFTVTNRLRMTNKVNMLQIIYYFLIFFVIQGKIFVRNQNGIGSVVFTNARIANGAYPLKSSGPSLVRSGEGRLLGLPE